VRRERFGPRAGRQWRPRALVRRGRPAPLNFTVSAALIMREYLKSMWVRVGWSYLSRRSSRS